MQKLEEAQDISEAVLDAEVKIGELMAKIPKKQGFASAIRNTAVTNVKTKEQIIENTKTNTPHLPRFGLCRGSIPKSV